MIRFLSYIKTLFFIDTFFLETPLKIEEIKEVFNNKVALIDNFNSFSSYNSFKDFEGFYESSNSFYIRKSVQAGFNSFLPVIYGELKQKVNKNVSIKLKFKLSCLIKFILLLSIILSATPYFFRTNITSYSIHYENADKMQGGGKVDYTQPQNFEIKKKIKKERKEIIFYPILMYLIFFILFRYYVKITKEELMTLFIGASLDSH